LTDLERALADAGGAAAPATATAQLKALLAYALEHGREELAKARSGYGMPILVAIAHDGEALLAAAPVDAALRADPAKVPARGWSLTAALVAALVDADGAPAPTGPADLTLRAGELGGHLALRLPAADADAADFAALSFNERVTAIDRLKARAAVLPAAALADAADLREPTGLLHVAEAVARLGGDPADPDSADLVEDALDALLGAGAAHARPHEDPDPARRVARRILQRLAGMGKWGGYHTEFTHLPRGFAGNDRALAVEVGEALLAAGLLESKPSVGQRHVYLNPRRAGEIHRFVQEGVAPTGLKLPGN
jgi:hypothetical protein